MAISLGGVALPDGTAAACSQPLGKIRWTDQFESFDVVTSTRRTVGGRLHYSQATLEGGRAATLEADEGVCWLTEAMKDALLALANATGPVTFVHGSDSYSVLVESADFRRKRISQDTYWYGTINLIILQ